MINKEDNKKKLEKLNAYKNDVDDDEEYQNFLLRLNNASILYIFLMRTAMDMQRIGVIFLKRLNSSLEKC